MEEEKKPGTTRLAFIALIATLTVLSVPVVVLSIRTDVEGLRQPAALCLGAIITTTGAVVNHYFGKKD